MIGRNVEITSAAGMVYRGIVRAIADRSELGELFELGSVQNPGYCRLVYVHDRGVQIREVDEPGVPAHKGLAAVDGLP
jgi:hypothetical protein